MRQSTLFKLACLDAGATFVLLLAGALVVGTGSGLSVPDWPLSFGQVFPPMEGGVVYEHSHRLIGAAVGLLTLMLFIGLWRSPLPPLLKRMGLWALLWVIVQGIFGGATVLYGLPPAVSIAHAALAQGFFVYLTALALLIKEGGAAAEVSTFSGTGVLRRLSLAASAVVFLQLLAGATLRHTGAGLHLHVAGAGAVVWVGVALLRRIVRAEGLPKSITVTAKGVGLLLILQLALGLYAWHIRGLGVTTLHLGAGALILAGCSVIAMESWRKLRPL